MIQLQTKTKSELSFAYKMILIGGLACVGLLIFNWVFGGWFLKTLFGGHMGNLWSPGKIVYVPEGILLSILMGLVGFLGLGLSAIVEHLIVLKHTGSGPVINPPSMIPGFVGAAAFIGGIVLVIRYLYIFAVIGYFAIIGTKVNFNVDLNQIKNNSRPVGSDEITRSKVDSLNLGFVDPDTLDQIFSRLDSGTSYYMSSLDIDPGVLIAGDMGANWSKYPVKVLAISYNGGNGLFESTGSFHFSDLRNGKGHYGRYWSIVDDSDSTSGATSTSNPVIATAIPGPSGNITYFWLYGEMYYGTQWFFLIQDHSHANADGFFLEYNASSTIVLHVLGGTDADQYKYCASYENNPSEPVTVRGHEGCFTVPISGSLYLEWIENGTHYMLGGTNVTKQNLLDTAESLLSEELYDLLAQLNQ
jgi:hypothetical protein